MDRRDARRQAPLVMADMELYPGDRIGPYVYRRVIGRGGMALVVLATAPDGREVALKILKPDRFRTGMRRFRREYRALSRIHHPNVVRVEAYGDIHGHPYIAMEYVPGTDLHKEIRAWRKLADPAERWRRCETVLVETCRGIAHVHERGLIHRDLKPSNVLIGLDRRCKLTDFGIVKEVGPPSDGQVPRLVGTWAYASPEQITGRPLDARSDLYSLGVILYAMLTGRRPFAAEDMAGYREAHVEQVPEPPSTWAEGVPEHLEAICMRLLRKRPIDRFQSAREILYELEASGPETSEEVPAGVLPLVGRGAELELIERTIRATRGGEGAMLLLAGPLASGRTRLLAEASERAGREGLRTHAVRVPEPEVGPQALVAWARLVAEDLGAATPASLRTALDWVEGRAAPEGDTPSGLTEGLRAGIEALLSRGPLLLTVDDLHLASDATVRGLVQFAGSLLRRQPVVVAAACDPDEARGELRDLLHGPLGQLPIRRVRLDPLAPPAVENLLVAMAGDQARVRALAQRLHDLSGGRPGFLAAYLLSLRQQGVLVEHEDGLALEADTEEVRSGHLHLPPEVRQAVGQRIRALPGPQLEVLEVLATATGELDLEPLLAILDQPEERVLDLLDALMDQHLVALHGGPRRPHVQVTERMVVEYVYRQLAPDRRRALHLAVARAIAAIPHPEPADLDRAGTHHLAAGEVGPAFLHFARAASLLHQRGLAESAWRHAERSWRMVDRAEAELDPDPFARGMAELLEVRAEHFYSRGAWERSVRAWRRRLEVARRIGDRAMAVQSGVGLARALARTGDAETAGREAAAALDEARAQHDRTGTVLALRTLAALAWEAGDLGRSERLAQEGLLLAGDAALRPLRGELLLVLAAVQALSGQLDSASRSLEEARALLEEMGRRRSACAALLNLAEMALWQGHPALALQRTSEAERMAETLDYRLGKAIARRIEGAVRVEVGQWARAQELLDRAIRLLRQLGVHGETIATRVSLARLARLRGDPRGVARHASIARGLVERGDPECYEPELVSLNAWVCALEGHDDDARRMLLQAERRLPDIPLPRRCETTGSLARAWLTLGDETRPRALALDAANLARSHGFRLLDLDARLLLSTLEDDPGQAARWREEARRLADTIAGELPPEEAGAFRRRPDLDLLAVEPPG